MVRDGGKTVYEQLDAVWVGIWVAQTEEARDMVAQEFISLLENIAGGDKMLWHVVARWAKQKAEAV